ncbi:RNA-guided endonuclease InsQ/TnpB family protein [Crocosphaera watsonii WH 8501]|uniref:Transposase, IS605 OrfB n=8 Tax=Crocosphaera watsonii TaxID=263511 RepID=Q4C608_CROWT|nr:MULTISPECIES: RNA-guided endonuclease TnpB family protein [Crocosphaera]EAM51586.1 Transposase, IS605 OrfB [Crocosphaera watsonii WH 8501]EHJ13528.1 Transposase, IS200/IS605 family [Crocosphaera watsonii WH 0003]MCH2245948.1 transposase [Crocosphaera sp.]CCQ64152.1 Transposase [Crocosphaera watsonii WH 0401]
MIVLEFKIKGKTKQYQAIDEAIRTFQFVRNKCLRYWMDGQKVNRAELYRYNTKLRSEFSFVQDLNSHACQASVERCWSSIARFFDNCKKQIPGKKGYPRFKKNTRSVEYKTSGWKLLDPKHIEFTDKKEIGKLKLIGTWDLAFYPQDKIKRVRLVRRADGYYCQFCISVDIKEELPPTHQTIGLDVGLKEFYTDSMGQTEPNPRFYRQGEKRLKFHQRRISRKKKGSTNRKKAINKLGRKHLKISRQREEHAKRLARCVIQSNDFVAYEDLRIRNLVKNHCLAKSINDAGWYQFRKWLEYFGKKMGRVTVAVNPAYTSQICSNCGAVVKKSLSTRTHVCACGCRLDRDENAAINILNRALGTVGHTGTWILDPNTSGDLSSTFVGAILHQQDESLIEESPCL